MTSRSFWWENVVVGRIVVTRTDTLVFYVCVCVDNAGLIAYSFQRDSESDTAVSV